MVWIAAHIGGHGALSSAVEQWDALHLLAIAGHGYPGHEDQQWSFFPLYPLLARSLWIGVAISIAAFWVALVAIGVIATSELGPETGARAVWLAAFFPTSLFFTAYYTEGLFLALSAGAVLAARRDRPAIAALLGLGAAATRSVGIALAPALLLLVRRRSIRARLLAASGPVLWVASFLGYAYMRAGDALAPVRAERNWGRLFHGPFAAVLPAAGDAADALTGATHPDWTFEPGWLRLTQFCFLLLAAAVLVWTLRRLPLGYAAYLLLALALPLSTFWPEHPLMSFLRFLAVTFPVYFCLGAVVTGRAAYLTILALESGLLIALSWRFGAGMWAG